MAESSNNVGTTIAKNILFSLAENLSKVIGSTVINEASAMWGYKSELKDLKRTLDTIKGVLLDAEAQSSLSHVQQDYIQKLKEVVYDADDLFDEFVTFVEVEQLQPHGEFLEKVCSRFFSYYNEVSVAHRMAHAVKDIKEKLDSIADDHQKFRLSSEINTAVISNNYIREETCNNMNTKNIIIGREEEREAMVVELLNPNVDDIKFLTICGVGGCGKTTLAKLVCNDENVKKEFSENNIWWVWVSDQDGVQFDVKTILCKILEVVPGGVKIDGSFALERVRKEFQDRVRGKKYLLILDDVWSEDDNKWTELQGFLMVGEKGSSVIVTTRSKKTSTIIGCKHICNLQGLSPENSWRLFEANAFKGEKSRYKDDDELVQIGRTIMEKCYNLPLALLVLGNLLNELDINEWSTFANSDGLSGISDGDNRVMSILKLSYNNLRNSSLKSCFTYCALFPKNTTINVRKLIRMWMAQGYVVPFRPSQSMEDAGKNYILILLERYFFQDALKDEYGDILWVKIHDLMYDVAKEIGRDEICVTRCIANNLEANIHHVHYVGHTALEWSLMSKIRSFVSRSSINTEIIGNNGVRLRMLDLGNWFGDTTSLISESIGTLLHLRYLDLSGHAYLEILPDSLTELHNLQTLILHACRQLRELPKDFSKLVKLRLLDLRWCTKLTSMPSGFDKLTNLRALPYFVGNLNDLKSLTEIEGDMHIEINGNYSFEEDNNDTERGFLRSMQYVREIKIEFEGGMLGSMQYVSESELEFEGGMTAHEAVMERLEPHRNLKGFILKYYHGKVIPRWGTADDNWATFLPYLVKVEIEYCYYLEQIPSLSTLPHLKSLELAYMGNLRYVENRSSERATDFFPSLQSLKLIYLGQLKGWWREDGRDDDDNNILRFPCLTQLRITNCSNLMSFPRCPRLTSLTLGGNNKNLKIIERIRDKEDDDVRLSNVDMDGSVRSLKLLRSPYLTDLSIKLVDDDTEVEEVFQCYASSLRSLTIGGCKITRLSGIGLQHLTCLNSLEISNNRQPYNINLNVQNDNVDDDETAWKSLGMSLRYLCITSQEDMTTLPRWVRHLTSLQSLSIKYCPGLISLPESIANLSSLRNLRIDGCPKVQQRCKQPNGLDWPIIQHIPDINIG